MKYALWFAILALASTGFAREATTSSALSVAATVRPNCVLRSPIGLDLGTYDPSTQNGAPLDAAGDVLSIQCTKGSPGVSVGLDNGQSYGGAHRNLHGGTGKDLVAYEVYTAADHATVWNMIQTVAYVPLNGKATAITMYGRVLPTRSAPHAGHYADSLLAMVNF